MTRQQLDLLIEYTNIKALIATKEAKGQGVSYHDYDRLVEIIGELEEMCDEQE